MELNIDNVLESLKNVAMKDGSITEEEQRLINVIIDNITIYSDLVEKALADGIISGNERDELFEQRMKVMENAYRTAREDTSITKDEANLLKVVCSLIIKLSEN